MHASNSYDLKASEQHQLQEIRDSIELHGDLYRTDRDGNLLADAGGNPVPADYVVLRSRRFLVDNHGLLWRFFAEGSPKNPNRPDRGGAPWRNNRVEMWTGRWRKVVDAEGTTTFVKALSPRPVDKRINGHPGMSQIDWYLTVKGYKHPFDEPHAPDGDDARGTADRAAIQAKMEAELDKAASTAGGAAVPGRTNKRSGHHASG